MSLNDLHPIRETLRREAHLIAGIRPAPAPRRILLYSMDTWQFGIFEQFLHLAFLLKGHRPRTVTYDGFLPISGWENHWVRPPTLEYLSKRAEFLFGCFGIAPGVLGDYLDRDQTRRRAEQFIAGQPDSALPDLDYRGIPIGRIARRDLFQYTLGHFEPRTADDIALFRRHLVHAVMSVDVARAILERERPDIVVLCNGKLVMYSYMYEVARRRGVAVTTWEEGRWADASVVLAHNDRAIDFPIEPHVWQAWMRRTPEPSQLADMDEYFRRWRAQTATQYRYYDDEIREFDRIRAELRLPPAGRLVSIFTNIVWDSNALDKDRAFDSMIDWVFTTIDATSCMKNTVLVVRAHPGEVKCPFRTRTTVRELILARYGGLLPAHVRIVDGASELSSYEIARHSFRCAVYTSTLGIELAMMGLQPLICGVPFYGGKGFTNDVQSRDNYRRCLTGEIEPRGADPVRLRHFMYLVIHRLVKRPEFFVGLHGSPQIPRIRIDSFVGWPASMPVFNEIVDCILERRSFAGSGVATAGPSADGGSPTGRNGRGRRPAGRRGVDARPAEAAFGPKRPPAD